MFVTCAQILLWFLKYKPLKLQICTFVLLQCFWGDGYELSSFSPGERRSGILTLYILWILLVFFVQVAADRECGFFHVMLI